MIAELRPEKINAEYQIFFKHLKKSAFEGEVQLAYGDRTVLATDNSIYQVMPQAVLYPSSTNDIVLIMQAMSSPQFRNIVISARGGGTGTNGQSLTTGIVLDTSRYMNQVLHIDHVNRWARVEAGTVKDVLNDSIEKYGLFFSPELSTSNRATVGGMVSTDASGQGSVTYGKTSDHVLELTFVLSDGTVWTSSPINKEKLQELCLRKDRVGEVYHILQHVAEGYRDQVREVYPKLPRGLTGYDLDHVITESGQYNLNALLCGSEGTLAILTEVKVSLLPIPKKTVMVLVYYSEFQLALLDARRLMSVEPASIETIDSNVLALAQSNVNIWSTVSSFFQSKDVLSKLQNGSEIRSVNYVEFAGDDGKDLEQSANQLIRLLNEEDESCIGYKVIRKQQDIQKLWHMRKLAVGLLGSMVGEARPIPFVEDVAVPPENLAPFLEAFKKILDQYKLRYGMFGHVDAGVMHVRPAIDMKDPKQAVLVRTISDQINQLALSYGGVLWGEHGKGMRSEYAPEVFKELYVVLQKIKAAFDPYNQLNPGKVAAPEGQKLLKIDEVATRGEYDRAIDSEDYQVFRNGMYCNGNGACFSYDITQAMCPTWKATLDRNQSPKGRASLVREWLRLQTQSGVKLAKIFDRKNNPFDVIKMLRKIWVTWFKDTSLDFSHSVYQALDSCMSCKSCVGQCPVKVDIPDLRARYFSLYYDKYCRPIRHVVSSRLEVMLPWLAKIKPVYNACTKSKIINRLLSKLIGLQDLPEITSFRPMQAACEAGAKIAMLDAIEALSDEQRKKSIILVQDAFTSYFETQLLVDVVTLLLHFGYQPFIIPFFPNGKILHVYGYLNKFHTVGRRATDMLKSYERYGVSMVGLDAAVTLTYRDEYREITGEKEKLNVLLLSEWFSRQVAHIEKLGYQLSGEYFLLGHCTESTNVPESYVQWKKLFSALGLTLTNKPIGCCGMSGIYGHEVHQQEVSKKAYNMNWKPVIDNLKYKNRLLATGFSCRCQVMRYHDLSLLHPIQIILEKLRGR